MKEKNIRSVEIYSSEHAKQTAIIVTFYIGQNRSYFKPGLNSKGKNILKSAEVLNDWGVIFSTNRIDKQLRQIFENPDLRPEGCPSAQEKYYAWKKEEKDAKCAKVDNLKAKRASMTKEDLAKANKGLWYTLEKEYILTCKRFLMEPKDFVKEEGQVSDEHYCTLIKNYKTL